MPEYIAETLVAIRPDTAGFRRDAERKIRTAVDQVEASGANDVRLDVDGSKLKTATTALKGFLAFEGAQIAGRLLLGVAGAASDVEEAVAASNVRFGEGAAIVQRYADNASRSLGISQAAALDAANSFGSLITNTGAGAEASAKLSTALVQLGGDIASLQKKDPNAVFTALASGLRGETEPLSALGVIMNETTVKAKAMALGLTGTNDELTEGEKVLARYAIILEQTGEEQGDFARTSDSYANATRTLRAELTDLASTVGGEVTPTMAEFTANVTFLLSKSDQGGQNSGIAKLTRDFGFLASPAQLGNKLLGELRERLGGAEDATDTYADANKGLAAALKSVSSAGTAATRTIDTIVSAQLQAIDATFAKRNAQQRLADAQRAVTEAEEAYGEALAGSGPHAERAAQAAERLEAAQEDLLRTQRRVRDLTLDIGEAQEELAGAQIRYGVGSKEARDAARALEGKQADLAEAQRDVADAADDVTEAQKEQAKVRDLAGVRAEAADKLRRAQEDLETAVYGVAKAEVNVAAQMAAARGEALSSTRQTDLLRQAVERLRDTEIPADSPLRSSLSALLAQLQDPTSPATAEFRQGERDFANRATLTLTDPGPAVSAPSLSPGAVDSAKIGVLNVNVHYPIDLNQLLEQAEYAAGIGD